MVLVLISAILSLILNSAFAHDLGLLASVKTNLTMQETQSGTFEQERVLSQMAVTLKSSGQFRIDKKSGLVWSQKKPFEFKMKFLGESIEIYNANEPVEIVKKSDNPMLISLSQTFSSFFNGDFSKIEKDFTLKASGKIQNWSISLTPKQESARKAIEQLIVTGDSQIKKIQVYDQQKNNMTIFLKHTRK